MVAESRLNPGRDFLRDSCAIEGSLRMPSKQFSALRPVRARPLTPSDTEGYRLGAMRGARLHQLSRPRHDFRDRIRRIHVVHSPPWTTRLLTNASVRS